MKEIEGGFIPASAIDRRLLEGASLFESANELSARVNGQLTPAQSIKRVNDLLAARDFYTVAQQMKLNVYRTTRFLNALEDDAMKVGDPKARNTYLATIRTLMDMTKQIAATPESITTKLSEAHASFFAQAIVGAFQIVRAEFQERGITVTEEEALEIMHAAANEGMRIIETHRENDE